jgi:hypothetical protein
VEHEAVVGVPEELAYSSAVEIHQAVVVVVDIEVHQKNSAVGPYHFWGVVDIPETFVVGVEIAVDAEVPALVDIVFSEASLLQRDHLQYCCARDENTFC